MAKRKSIGKKVRFEVFKRDGFKCQYCGAEAPNVVLELDHIHPVSKGGDEDVMNYITSCKACNAGKSDRTLDDDSVIKKQKAQLDELNERREQIEMMLQWRDALRDIGTIELDSVCSRWSGHAKGWGLNDKGKKQAKALLKKHGLALVLEAMEEAADAYLEFSEDGKATPESVGLAWSKVGGFLRMKSMPEDKRRLYYIQGIMRNRFSYVPFGIVKELGELVDFGVPVEDIELEAKTCRSWTQFRNWMTEVQA